jgi:hypothetical protein
LFFSAIIIKDNIMYHIWSTKVTGQMEKIEI